MGFFDIFKKSKKQQIRDNAEQGRQGEEQVKSRYEWAGYKVKRTGRGHDYRATRRNWLNGKKETKYIEVKTGDAKLSPLQRKKKKQYGSKYKVERVDTNPFGSVFNSGERKSRKKSTSSGMDFFGSTKSKPRKRKQSDDWGFGNGNSGMDFFGSGSSKRKRKRKDDDWGFGF